jgi:hypothetical protein
VFREGDYATLLFCRSIQYSAGTTEQRSPGKWARPLKQKPSYLCRRPSVQYVRVQGSP